MRSALEATMQCRPVILYCPGNPRPPRSPSPCPDSTPNRASESCSHHSRDTPRPLEARLELRSDPPIVKDLGAGLPACSPAPVTTRIATSAFASRRPWRASSFTVLYCPSNAQPPCSTPFAPSSARHRPSHSCSAALQGTSHQLGPPDERRSHRCIAKDLGAGLPACSPAPVATTAATSAFVPRRTSSSRARAGAASAPRRPLEASARRRPDAACARCRTLGTRRRCLPNGAGCPRPSSGIAPSP